MSRQPPPHPDHERAYTPLSYVNSVLTGRRMALQQQQHLLSSQKDVVPEERLAMMPTPRVKSDGAASVPPEMQVMKQAEERASEYSATCVANDRAPIGLVVKQTLARASTLDLTKCDARSV